METQPQQSLEGIFQDKGYRAGQVFKRKDCLDYDLGYSTYSGKYSVNCDGVVMLFNDGKEVLNDFCELARYDCPEVLWAVAKEVEMIEKSAKEKIQTVLQEYNQIKQ